MDFEKDFEQPLLRLAPGTYFTCDAATRHALAVGASGSGKTSAAAKSLTKAYLLAGMGALALCYKVDEADLWEARARETGRSPSLMRWSGPNYRFNFVSYFVSKYGVSGIGAVVECLVALLDMIRLASPAPGRPSEQFWTDAIRELLRNTLGMIFAAYSVVKIRDVVRFIRSAPHSPEQIVDPNWQRQSFFFETCARARDKVEEGVAVTSLSYFKDDWSKLDGKTRSNIQISLTTALGRLSSGLLNDVFCTDTTIFPELCFDGAIIVMDFPPAEYGEDGLVAQLLFKYCFQQAMLARNGYPPEYRRRFVALVMDECQAFVVPQDADFLATCRSSRVCVLALTQSLPTLYAKIGGDNPQYRAQQFAGNFSTKIFFANSCVETNTWASNIIGRSLQRRSNVSEGRGTTQGMGLGMGEGTNWGTSAGGGTTSSSSNNGYSSGRSWNSSASEGGNESWNRSRNGGSSWNSSQGYSEQMDLRIEPAAFGQILQTGGHANDGIVTGIWYESGRRFAASGDNTLYLSWRQ